MKTFLLPSLLLLITQIYSQDSKLITPLKSNNFQSLSTSIEIERFLHLADSISEKIIVEEIGRSVKEKPIYLVKVSNDFNYESEKLNIFFFAQQHGNEPSGKEGLLYFIQKIVDNQHHDLLEKVNLLLIPQVNPDGSDEFKRRNANDIDLNRDHLLLRAPESRVVQKVFREYIPEVAVDIHEYYPYGKYWRKFGFRKNFDIQLGGITNINVEEEIRSIFKDDVFYFVKDKVESKSYSFFEYTLGDLPDGERLRHSTVDINDGRQSIGITNTLSFIIEGMRGEEKTDSIKRRAESQYVTILALVESVSNNADELKNVVNNARQRLNKGEIEDSVAIRLDHFQGEEPLHYPLISVETGNDSVFVVEKYFSKVEATLNVAIPKGYLIPKNDSNLVKWLKRSGIEYKENFSFNGTLMHYKLGEIKETIDEGYKNKLIEVEKGEVTHRMNVHLYYFVPVNQIFMFKLITALEPQAMYGLVYYPEFEYLLENEYFPILRVE